MASKLVLCGVAIAPMAVSSPVSGAPIDIVARLNPGQSGPVYAWSLYLDLAPGYEVGSVNLVTSGFDAFSFNTANPAISLLDSVFLADAIGDGRGVLIVNNVANGVAFSPTPAHGVLLGTLYSPFSRAVSVLLEHEEDILGPVVYDPDFNPYPLDAYAIFIVPAPEALVLVAVALVCVAARLLGGRGRALG